MSEWNEGFVEANGLEVFYLRTGVGSNKPVVLLLHGYTDNGRCWTQVAQALEADYDVVMFDARGHGQTRGPVEDLSVKRLADDAAAAAQKMGLANLAVFGHSMGGITALAMAADYPDLVRAAVLEDPTMTARNPIVYTDEEKQKLQEAAIQDLKLHDLPLAEQIARGQSFNNGWPMVEIQPWAEAKGQYNPQILQFRGEFRRYDWREAIGRVECPILLLTAEVEQGAIVTSAIAEEAGQLCHSCQTSLIHNAGHCIHRDQFEASMRSVLGFLSRPSTTASGPVGQSRG